jgi:hypothetical protein
MLEEIGKFVAATFVVSGILAWLIRSLVTHLLSKDVESYKQALQSQAGIELEKLKHELRLAATEHEKQVSLLHEKRAEVIAELHSKLIDFLGAAEVFVSHVEYEGDAPKSEKAKTLGEKAVAFHRYFIHHRIYFTEELCSKVKTLFDSITSPARTYRIWLDALERSATVTAEYQKAWDEAVAAMNDKVPPLELAVRAEFRALLGVDRPLPVPPIKHPGQPSV